MNSDRPSALDQFQFDEQAGNDALAAARYEDTLFDPCMQPLNEPFGEGILDFDDDLYYDRKLG